MKLDHDPLMAEMQLRAAVAIGAGSVLTWLLRRVAAPTARAIDSICSLVQASVR